MMATAAFLNKIPNPTDADIDANIINVCRCATYYRMRKAIHRAAELNVDAASSAETQTS
jgi:isoquinoline 1-oxidoreductase alpha subunit